MHDFLPTLQAHQKWKKERDNITVGTVVVIADEQLLRALWRFGTVSSIIPSPDGRIRTAVIKVKEHTYTRLVAKSDYPLYHKIQISYSKYAVSKFDYQIWGRL